MMRIKYGRILAAIFLLYSIVPINAVDRIDCKVLNVGQGNGVCIKDELKGRYLILDAGSSRYPTGKNLQSLGDLLKYPNEFVGIAPARPRCIVISHPDQDHLNIITEFLSSNSASLIKEKSPITIYLGGPLNIYATKTPATELLKTIKKFISKENFSTQSLSHQIAITIGNIDQIIDGTLPNLIDLQRPFFLNVRIPEFSDIARNLSTIINLLRK